MIDATKSTTARNTPKNVRQIANISGHPHRRSLATKGHMRRAKKQEIKKRMARSRSIKRSQKAARNAINIITLTVKDWAGVGEDDFICT